VNGGREARGNDFHRHLRRRKTTHVVAFCNRFKVPKTETGASECTL
jgi:hypothetical protein